MSYSYPGYGSDNEECIDISTVDQNETEGEVLFAPRDDEDYLDEDETPDEPFVSGYCKKRDDGSVVIAFGKNAKETLQKVL